MIGVPAYIVWDANELNKLAYDMQAAYVAKKTQSEAVEMVKDRNSLADVNVLWAMWSAIDAYEDMRAEEIAAPQDNLEELKDKMQKIRTWIDAYPIDVFPEPDFKRAHAVLKQHAISLAEISVSNMRHVLNGIREIIEE